MDITQNKTFLLELAKAKMPFGKYKDRYLTDIPEAYFVWFKQKGFPKGKLGQQLEAMHEIKVNGLEGLVRKIRG
ncbi:DUF3820 family protein [Galbibacter sp. EGI 63066]|uniref:DUF3820 family protein n=1 Tax=Galbibacter sp. EGI 63066 TaxID=2993559 RepID=UPI002248BAF1|nr:DUF3820 family protein [Galbibacter sp. EGI 63066]MCX2678427.1 DUF3820 family protein [Galbibacter sp. EGI 63066]